VRGCCSGECGLRVNGQRSQLRGPRARSDVRCVHPRGSLFLDGNLIGDAGLRLFSRGLVKLSSLQELDLYHNRIGNEGLAAFSSAIKWAALPQLHTLLLDRNRIADAGALMLAAACGSGALPRLFHLFIGCNNISSSGKRAIAAALVPRPELCEMVRHNW